MLKDSERYISLMFAQSKGYEDLEPLP